MFALITTASFKPISNDCNENFIYFKQFYNASYANDSEVHDIFCENFENLLKIINNCSYCAITPFFDQKPSELFGVDTKTTCRNKTPQKWSQNRNQLHNVSSKLSVEEEPEYGARTTSTDDQPTDLLTCQEDYCYATDPLKTLRNLPQQVDLRQYGLLTAAKDQGSFSSCWSFAITAAVENSLLLQQKTLKSRVYSRNAANLNLSEQFVLRNTFNRENLCDGSDAVIALNYITEHNLAFPTYEIQRDLPYSCTDEAQIIQYQQQALFNISQIPNNDYYIPYNTFQRVKNEHILDNDTINTPIISLMNDQNYELFDSNRVMNYLARGIAVFAAMYADTSDSNSIFLSYDGDRAFSGIGCPVDCPNHQVLFAGYGYKNGVKSWLVRNSWNTSWGDNDYFYVKMGENNFCIEEYAYALIPKGYDIESIVPFDMSGNNFTPTSVKYIGFDSDSDEPKSNGAKISALCTVIAGAFVGAGCFMAKLIKGKAPRMNKSKGGKANNAVLPNMDAPDMII